MFFDSTLKNSTNPPDHSNNNSEVNMLELILIGGGLIGSITLICLVAYCILNRCWRPNFKTLDHETPSPYPATPGSKIEAISYNR